MTLLFLLTTSLLFQNYRLNTETVYDFHLSPGSPAIGTGLCLPEVPFDFDGVPRPNRPPNTYFPGDTGCEIGAYQYVAAQTGTPIIVNGSERLTWVHDGMGIMRFDLYIDSMLIRPVGIRIGTTNNWQSGALRTEAPSLTPGIHQVNIVACSDASPPSAADECSLPSNTITIDYRPPTQPLPPTNLGISNIPVA